MKELLSREGHAFTTQNVDEDDAALEDLLARGFRAVPVTFIGERAVTGFNERMLREALAAACGS